MATLDPTQLAVIEADPRVIELAKSRGPLGVVSTAELRQLGYDVPPHTKFALAHDGKGFRSAGTGKVGFVYIESHSR